MNRKLLGSMLALWSVGLSACVPLEVRCVMPPVPANLPDPKPEGYFEQRLNSILAPYESLPAKPTGKSQPTAPSASGTKP
jgi:hypothetical protein